MAQVPSEQTVVDPDVLALLEQTRLLVNQAHRLSRSIDETVEELQEFHNDLAGGSVTEYHERRKTQQPYEGDDRRDHHA